MNKEFNQKSIKFSNTIIPLVHYFLLWLFQYFIFFTIICFLATSYEWHKMNKKNTFKLLGLYIF